MLSIPGHMCSCFYDRAMILMLHSFFTCARYKHGDVFDLTFGRTESEPFVRDANVVSQELHSTL